MPKHDTSTEPEALRRELAAAYRREGSERRWKKNERVTFLHMAEAWERTFPEPKKK